MRRPLVPALAVCVLTILAACNGDSTAPREVYDPCVGQTQQDTLFQLWPDSMRLTMASADESYADWYVIACNSDATPPGSEITWTFRDSSIVEGRSLGPDVPALRLVPRTPGSTWLVAEAGRWLDSLPIIVPDTVPMPPSAALAAGGSITCSVTEGGETFCWGDGGAHVLGPPETSPGVGTCWGIPCSPMPVPRGDGMTDVFVGRAHACTLTADGSAWCWGSNVSLQLGGAGGDFRANPLLAGDGISFRTLSLGGWHTCGLTDDGTAYCWGDHWGGRLGGDQRTGPVSTPVRVSTALRFSSLDASDQATCGTSIEGGLYCWGYLPSPAPPGAETCSVSSGKSGSADVPCAYLPLRMSIASGLGSDSLFVEVRGSCALTTEGSVYCRDDVTGDFEPQIDFGPYASLVADRYHTCGLTDGGVAECWGSLSSGALGNGTDTPRFTPTAVTGGHIFVELAAGQGHTCGRTADGIVWCWGENSAGQAGVSILERPLSPMKVRGQG